MKRVEIDICENDKAELFCNLFQYVKVVSESITIHFLKDEFFVQLMDPSHVSIMEIRIPSTWFTRYDLGENGEPTTMSINATILFRVLGSRDKLQTLKMQYDEEEVKLHIFFEAGNKELKVNNNIIDKEFSILLMDLQYDIMEIPGDMSYDAEISLPSSSFASNVNIMQNFADTMQIRCSEKNISFHSKGTDTGEMKMTIYSREDDEEAEEEGQEEEEEELKLSFSLNYLHNICLYHKIAKEIVLNMKVGFPMKAVYDLGNDLSILFYLAPKIDDDDM